MQNDFGMKIIRINKSRPDFYKDFNEVSFWSVPELLYSVRFQNLNISLMNAAIFHASNQERRNRNLPTCEFHPKLSETSMLHSAQMKSYNFFSHENLYEPQYKTLGNRIEFVFSNDFQGFLCAGENISEMKYLIVHQPRSIGLFKTISYLDISQRVTEGWMNSEGHRLNILNSQFRFLGCGCVPYEYDDNGLHQEGLKITQNFGGDLIINSIPKMVTQKHKFRILKK